jgi:hypothetical protein
MRRAHRASTFSLVKVGTLRFAHPMVLRRLLRNAVLIACP